MSQQKPVIEDCACGQDHWEMPMIDVYRCDCDTLETPDPDCSHETLYAEGVCRIHERHIPCRYCDTAGYAIL